MKEDIPAKFWRKYIEADEIDKEKTLEPIVKVFDELYKVQKGTQRRRFLLITMRGYFDDLIDYLRSNEDDKR